MNDFAVANEEVQSNVHASHSLEQFLLQWDQDYLKAIENLPLFDPQQTSQWTLEQRQFFVRTFYHVRGHFHNFLWHLGNFAPDKATKEIILHNIEEEFGSDGCSHEQLYFKFAQSLGVDNLLEEGITKKHDLPFIKKFNQEHLVWLNNHDWEVNMATFAAYERLDNIDYAKLVAIMESFDNAKQNNLFFYIHTQVKHFEPLLAIILNIWQNNSEKIRYGFNFIKNNQLKMWKNLSEAILKHGITI